MKTPDNKNLSSRNRDDVRSAETLQIKLHAIQRDILAERRSSTGVSGSGQDIQAYNVLEKQYNSLICELNCE